MANDVQPAALAGVPATVDLTAYVLLARRICFTADVLLVGARKFASPSII